MKDQRVFFGIHSVNFCSLSNRSVKNSKNQILLVEIILESAFELVHKATHFTLFGDHDCTFRLLHNLKNISHEA